MFLLKRYSDSYQRNPRTGTHSLACPEIVEVITRTAIAYHLVARTENCSCEKIGDDRRAGAQKRGAWYVDLLRNHRLNVVDPDRDFIAFSVKAVNSVFHQLWRGDLRSSAVFGDHNHRTRTLARQERRRRVNLLHG